MKELFFSEAILSDIPLGMFVGNSLQFSLLLNFYNLCVQIYNTFFLFIRQQIYSIDVYTDNYLPFLFKDLFRLFLNYFLLHGCVNISNTIGWFSMT